MSNILEQAILDLIKRAVREVVAEGESEGKEVACLFPLVPPPSLVKPTPQSKNRAKPGWKKLEQVDVDLIRLLNKKGVKHIWISEVTGFAASTISRVVSNKISKKFK